MNFDTVDPEDVVDGFMIPAPMNVDQKRQADEELIVVRRRRKADQSEQERLYGQLLQLKIHIDDYIKQDTFDSEKTFAYFFKKYIELQQKKKREVASELDIQQTKINQLISGTREPSDDIFIRLEFHSNQFISAREWFLLAAKKHVYKIMTNTVLRNKEKEHVKGHLQLKW